MEYRIAPEVFEAFPGYVRGVVVARDCRIGADSPLVSRLLQEAVAEVRGNPKWQAVGTVPRIAAWRAAFSRFGATPSKFPSSVEAILKRAYKGDTLPYINDAVAVGTYLTVKHALPTGGHDLDRVQGGLKLTFARGDEPFMPLGGFATEYPSPGEVIYRDHVKVLCRRWVWRQSDDDKMTEATRDLEMNVDGLPPATPDEVRAAMAECAGLIRQVTGADCRQFILSASRQAVRL